MSQLLQIQSLSLRFPEVAHPILHQLDYNVEEGDFIMVLGGNGSGKSSLMRCLSGIYPPSSGRIIFKGKPISECPKTQLAQDLVLFSQNTRESLFEQLSVLENAILYELRYQKASWRPVGPPAERKAWADYLKNFHPRLGHHLDTAVHRLSGGERQALMLALCLKRPPELLLLDEHTSALDPKASALLLEKTVEFILRYRLTCLMTTHNLQDALRFGNRLLALKEGRIVYQAQGEEKARLRPEQLLQYCY